MTKSDEDRRRNAIRHTLLDNVKPKISNREFFSAGTFDATTLVLEDPYAFLIASCLDRGTRSERIWTIPYDLKQRLRALDVVAIAEIPQRKLDEIIRDLPNMPRFVNDAAKTILDLSRMIRDEFSGRAQEMWQGRSPETIQERSPQDSRRRSAHRQHDNQSGDPTLWRRVLSGRPEHRRHQSRHTHL